jgi:uncharacterized protein
MGKVFRSLVLPLALAAALLTAGASAQEKKDKDKGKDAAAVFEVYKDSADEFRFRLKDGEGTLLATSGKGYKNKADCLQVVDTIKKDAAKAKVEEMK